jgi:hypothetical protein
MQFLRSRTPLNGKSYARPQCAWKGVPPGMLSPADDNGFGQQELQNDGMIARSATAFLICMQAAHASLGGDSASIASDAAGIRAVDIVTSTQGYDVYAITAVSGMRIWEFTDRTGRVFAVSWSGPVTPDLSRLLGTSFAPYTAALANIAHRPLHRVVRVVTPTLVVESGGHMRAFSGRAYLPALLPAGMPVSDVH